MQVSFHRAVVRETEKYHAYCGTVYVRVCTYVYTHVCSYVHAYVYMYTYTWIHIALSRKQSSAVDMKGSSADLQHCFADSQCLFAKISGSLTNILVSFGDT